MGLADQSTRSLDDCEPDLELVKSLITPQQLPSSECVWIRPVCLKFGDGDPIQIETPGVKNQPPRVLWVKDVFKITARMRRFPS